MQIKTTCAHLIAHQCISRGMNVSTTSYAKELNEKIIVTNFLAKKNIQYIVESFTLMRQSLKWSHNFAGSKWITTSCYSMSFKFTFALLGLPCYTIISNKKKSDFLEFGLHFHVMLPHVSVTYLIYCDVSLKFNPVRYVCFVILWLCCLWRKHEWKTVHSI